MSTSTSRTRRASFCVEFHLLDGAPLTFPLESGTLAQSKEPRIAKLGYSSSASSVNRGGRCAVRGAGGGASAVRARGVFAAWILIPPRVLHHQRQAGRGRVRGALPPFSVFGPVRPARRRMNASRAGAARGRERPCAGSGYHGQFRKHSRARAHFPTRGRAPASARSATRASSPARSSSRSRAIASGLTSRTSRPEFLVEPPEEVLNQNRQVVAAVPKRRQVQR